ncbi:hypothetical protein EJ03DRAFT_279306 [Teratosphaeria nubilosa]|uniref:BZIP domain-containing protein n=1 Tax=Teratosphaeria nubilosa TaxID=161662 RepID=A0A6G1KZ04_9PEZI|nr:hypothetical protein EJ03DRAFT_279306 [Teratosphaeria nubilosa]
MADNRSAAVESMAAASKVEPEAAAAVAEGTPSSVESTPEQEVPAEVSQHPAPQPQKRKGGRKPIYATSEERKQRNRQAQAAFRERRTEYIKQLEATIKQNEETLANLQQSHRTAADECLMLRYKNSLLERILLEKGIDVQAELSIKTGSPILGPGVVAPAAGLPQPQASQPQLQRTAVQRQHARRSGQGFLPKLAPGQTNQDMVFAGSPQGHPTPSSHTSSPTNMPTRSPMTMQQGGMTPPMSSVVAQGQAQQFHTYPRSSQQPPNASFYAPQQSSTNIQRSSYPPQQTTKCQNVPSAVANPSSLNSPLSAGHIKVGASAYYPSPFQKHIDQLGKTEQEYDMQHTRSMLDHSDIDADGPHHSANASPTQLQGNYPPQFGDHAAGRQEGAHDYYQQGYGVQQPEQTGQAGTGYGVVGQIDPDDPMLDADPFGLSASMHYPTTYGAMNSGPQLR